MLNKPSKAHNTILLFVYGTLKEGYGNNWYLQRNNAEKVANTTTAEEYIMFNAGFPVMMEPVDCNDLTLPALQCKGEVWKLNNVALEQVDRLESNGDMYNRKEITVTLEDGTTMNVWSYFGGAEYWEGGDRLSLSEIIGIDNGEYYQWE
jgi:gamma-glutamylcyclotransferase (GGCT)/AIG2-like uncharacterized protein YtfP